MLGAQPQYNAYYGQGSGPVQLGYLQCTGSESQLVNCVHTSKPSCGHYDDAGVQCAGTAVME